MLAEQTHFSPSSPKGQKSPASIFGRAFSLVELVELVGTHEGSPAGVISLPGFCVSTPNGSEWDFQISPFLARATQRCVRDCPSRSRRAPLFR